MLWHSSQRPWLSVGREGRRERGRLYGLYVCARVRMHVKLE